jgi:hypothetical protein
MLRLKAAIASLSIAGLLIGVAPATVDAQRQEGLVNVYIADLIYDTEILSRNQVGIGVAANVAAQICGLTAQVGVIAQQVARTGSFTCPSVQEADQEVRIRRN